jgi:hypothetical protein
MRTFVLLIAGALGIGCGRAADSSSCPSIAAQAQQIVSTAKSCMQDSDCSFYDRTACGLEGQCGATISVSSKSQLDGVIASWSSECPKAASQCPVWPVLPPGAHCVTGMCQCEGNGC